MNIFQAWRQAPVTIALIAISIAIALISRFGQIDELTRYLYIDWAAIQQGQLWRLFTPIFLHFGIAHIAFNALWTWLLGRALEVNFGGLKVLLGAALAAACSNLAQLHFSGANFGGLSGVVYALFGFNLILKQRLGRCPLPLSPQIEIFMLAWLLLGWLGILNNIVGPMANWAHTAGLACGVIIGGLWPPKSALRR